MADMNLEEAFDMVSDAISSESDSNITSQVEKANYIKKVYITSQVENANYIKKVYRIYRVTDAMGKDLRGEWFADRFTEEEANNLILEEPGLYQVVEMNLVSNEQLDKQGPKFFGNDRKKAYSSSSS